MFGALTLSLNLTRSNVDWQARLPSSLLFYRQGLTSPVLRNEVLAFLAEGRIAGLMRLGYKEDVASGLRIALMIVYVKNDH